MSKKLSIDELLKETQQLLRDTKRKVCRECKETKQLVQSNYCEDCYKKISERRAKERVGRKLNGGDGYVRTYNEEGKLVLEHRHLMEQHLGRKLKKEEVVLHLDGNKSNNDLSNLVLGFKNGTPFSRLKCNQCNTIGNISVV